MAKGKQWVNILMTFLLITTFALSCKAPKVNSESQPIDHIIWDQLLHQYVDQGGLVDYKAMLQDSHKLERYLDILRKNHPNDNNWSKNQTMAYWINAYNAFTVELILRNYPVPGIKEIKNGVPFVNSVWDIKFINIEGMNFDLNNIEHGILRKQFDDPRVHFALVCGSMACPKLQRFAFTAERLNEQLDLAGRQFFNEPFRNDINASPAKLSKILSWYWMDFKDTYASRIDLVNAYAEKPLPSDHDFEFLKYDWTLNEQTEKKRKRLQSTN